MKTEKPCRWYPQYKAIHPPKCNCQPCEDKYNQNEAVRKRFLSDYDRLVQGDIYFNG